MSHEPMPMNATPTTDFKMIQPKFLFGGAEAGFDCPTPKRNPEQPPQSDPVTANDSIGKKVFDFAGADVASDYQSVPVGWKFVDSLAIEQSRFDFPDFRAVIGVFDAVALPVLFGEYGRVSCQIVDLSTDVLFSNSLAFEVPPPFGAVRRWRDDFGFGQPAMKNTWNFADKRLLQFIHPVQELRVFAVGFVERPRADADAAGQRVLDLCKRDLLLGLKFNVIRHVVFLRSTGSSAQDFGRYIRLSSKH